MKIKAFVISFGLLTILPFDQLCAFDDPDSYLGCHVCQMGTSVYCIEREGKKKCEEFLGTDADNLKVLCDLIAAHDSVAQESCQVVVSKRKPEADALIKTGKATPDAICKILRLCDPRK
uniref:Saposin B-type domain-containing protein n=1 Tax=Ditylenchus dipsaci TaxID=166011 RepID=A0A915D0M1_9BILA